jgi:hypothetical protein
VANPTITIPLDPQTAKAYDSANPDQKRKIQALLSLRLRELTSEETPQLDRILNEVGQKARAQGLTPELLESLLKGG